MLLGWAHIHHHFPTISRPSARTAARKGVRAVDLAEGTKPEMVKALIDYFAAKRTRRANTVLPAGLAAGGAVPEEEQEEQEAAL